MAPRIASPRNSSRSFEDEAVIGPRGVSQAPISGSAGSRKEYPRTSWQRSKIDGASRWPGSFMSAARDRIVEIFGEIRPHPRLPPSVGGSQRPRLRSSDRFGIPIAIPYPEDP